MGWAIGYDEKWKRDIGYGVPAVCDHPDCNKTIDRGLAFVCGGEPYGGEQGCGLYFCGDHLGYVLTEDGEDDSNQLCERCQKLFSNPCDNSVDHFDPKPDTKEWIDWKLTDESWAEWRKENPDFMVKHPTPGPSK